MAFRWRADDGPPLVLFSPQVHCIKWHWIKNVVGTLQFASIRVLRLQYVLIGM